MASRTVALDEEAYARLSRLRKPDESFSDAVKRLTRPRRPISEFAGMWADMSPKERSELERVYSEMRSADSRRADLIRKTWG